MKKTRGRKSRWTVPLMINVIIWRKFSMTIFIIQACGIIKEEIVPEAQVDILFISDLGNVVFVFFAATLFWQLL